jgi:glycosyltransferase involved in cell wall biosynthesis
MMKRVNKLLSIIIPTRNRYECLTSVISALLKYIDDDNFEIVIQDNSDNNTIITNYLTSINDDRLSYYFTDTCISVKENTELAISNSVGEFITFIGDDDLVSPYIVDIVTAMKIRNINSLIFNSGKYWWQNVSFKKKNYYNKPSSFLIPKNVSSVFMKLNTFTELDLMLSHGATSSFRLPKFYHGIISRDLLIKIKDKSSISPDISFSTALGLVCTEHYFINFPATIYGASKNSGGGMTMEKKHYGKIEDQSFLPKNAKEIWDELIPEVWSEHTTYPVSVSHVLQQFSSNKTINYNVFFSSMLVYEFYLFKYLKPKIFKYNKFNIIGYLILFYQILKRISGLLLNKIKVKLKKLDFVVYEDFTINDCMIELKKITFNERK